MYNTLNHNRVNQASFRASMPVGSIEHSINQSFNKLKNRFREIPEIGRFKAVSEPLNHRGFKINLQIENCEEGDLLPKYKDQINYRRMVVAVNKARSSGLENSEVLAIGHKNDLNKQINDLDSKKIIDFVKEAFEHIR